MQSTRTENSDASPSVPAVRKALDQEQSTSQGPSGWFSSTGSIISVAVPIGSLDYSSPRERILSYTGSWFRYGCSGRGKPTASSVADTKIMTYNRRPVDDAIESYLHSIDHSAKAREIAEAIDYHRSYIGKRCREMADKGILDREEGGFIIGHEIPGRDNPTILNSDRTYLLEIVQDHKPERLSEAQSMSVQELRDLIKREIATATFPLGNRTVSYSTG